MSKVTCLPLISPFYSKATAEWKQLAMYSSQIAKTSMVLIGTDGLWICESSTSTALSSVIAYNSTSKKISPYLDKQGNQFISINSRHLGDTNNTICYLRSLRSLRGCKSRGYECLCVWRNTSRGFVRDDSSWY